MILDLDKMSETAIKNYHGGDKDILAKMFNDEYNRIMKAKLIPGASVGMHKHENNSEILFVISGTGTATCNGNKEKLSPGVCHYCPKGLSHAVTNDGTDDLIFYAVVVNQ